MAEFDRLGRDAFLTKYKFRPARSYFVLHDGRRYDSKALAGSAFGYQFPQSGPLKAADFSGGEATVKARLERLGFRLERLESVGRNPKWTREETILAMDLYARRRPQLPGEGDREIIELSQLLGTYGSERGIVAGPTFRNPNGVSMKVGNLSRLDAQDDRKGLPHGSSMEYAVWAEFMPDVAKLRSAADAIRKLIGATASAGAPSAAGTSSTDDPTAQAAVSRGPRPSFGDVTTTRTDGENCVYIMRLSGRVADLFPKRTMHGMAVLKIGRSNDVNRRALELNCGFPPGLDLRWVPSHTQMLPSADQAHDIEQALLRDLTKRGMTIGGEFAVVPERQVDTLLADAMRPAARG